MCWEGHSKTMARAELKHHFRIIDMMLTMHSILRDRYQRRAFTADLLVLSSSIILCVVQFLDTDILKTLHIDPKTAQIAGGVSSIFILLVSLVSVMVNWSKKAEKHSHAVGELSRLKAQCREILKSDTSEDNDARTREQNKECAWALQNVKKIPDRKFNELKALHKRKVALSKMIDDHPGCPLFLLRLKLTLMASQGVFQSHNLSEAEGEGHEQSAGSQHAE